MKISLELSRNVVILQRRNRGDCKVPSFLLQIHSGDNIYPVIKNEL